MKHQKHIVDSQTLAAHWGISDRRVRQLVDEGITVKAPGGFDLVESDRRLIERYRRDDETKALKRRVMQQQMQVAERRLQRQEREWISIDEVREFLTKAWSRMWDTHSSIASHAYTHLRGLPEDQIRDSLFRLDRDVKGELRLLRDDFDAITKMAMEKLNCELRNGIFIKTREIGMLKAELGIADEETDG